MNFNIALCEKIIGYSFKNKDILINAFTHASYSNEHKKLKSNERLEFLGDSLLGFIVSEALYDNSTDDEGKLTLKKQALVSKKPLSKSVIDAGLNEFLLLGEGEKSSSQKINLAENLFESIVAAIYLDGGIDNAKKFVFNFLDVNALSTALIEQEKLFDYKSKLLHIVQKKRLGEVVYSEIAKDGPPHKPIFTMAVSVGNRILAKGRGSSHKAGEQEAAKAAIDILQSEDSTL